MISLEDCVALSGLTEEQILAIAEHEQLPEIAAAAFAQYLLKQEHGMEKIRDMETSPPIGGADTECSAEPSSSILATGVAGVPARHRGTRPD
jgi:hypothetical protein